jgi:hypothetical protein
MPISAVGVGRNTDGASSLREVVRASGMVKRYGPRVEVDSVGNIVPYTCRSNSANHGTSWIVTTLLLTGLKLSLPLSNSTDHPLQIQVLCARSTGDQAILHLCEVALEEAHLMLEQWTWCICTVMRYTEMVVHLPFVDCRGCLRNQFCSSHILAVPV